MKLKYLFAACVACLGLAVACEDDPQYVLEELQVDKSYVAIPMTGGSDEITVTSSQSWSFDETLIPDWLTVTPTSGSNGETTVTFSAPETKVGRNVELKINVGDKEQYVEVMQGLKVATTSTCAEVISGEDGVLYRVTGTCTGISNTTYGNWFLQDSTGEIYIYGTLDSQGAEKNFSSLGIEVGDIVTVEGPKSTYNGTVELVNVTVINIVKSLLKIDPTNVSLNKTDTSFVVKAAVKSGSTFDWKLNPDNDWMHISSTSTVGDTVFVTVHALANDAMLPRTGEITFTASNSDQTTTQTLSVYQSSNAPELTSIADGLKTEFAHVKGNVTAVTKVGYVLTDDSGSALVYYGSSYDKGYAVGDQVELVATPGAYNYGPQFASPVALDQKIGTTTITYPTPTLVDESFVSSTIASLSGHEKTEAVLTTPYVVMYGQAKVSGNYTNIILHGVTSSTQGSVYNKTDDITIENGANVKVCGYLVSISGGTKYFNVAVTSVEAWDGGDIIAPKVLYENDFLTADPTANGWTIDNKTLPSELSYIWAYSSNYGMKASAYNSTSYASESWLISPDIDASDQTAAYLTFQHVGRYFDTTSDFTLWAKKDGGSWTQVTIPTYSSGSDWTYVDSGVIDLSAFTGGSFKIAFKYTSTAEHAGTWEIKNVKIANTQ